MSDVLQTRLTRLDRLIKIRARIIKTSGSLAEARNHPQWDVVNTLISVLRIRIEASLEPANISERLSAGEIALIALLFNNINEL